MGTPFREQLAFFRAKVNVPTERWDDLWQAAHDRAFVVAGAAQADLLQDLREAVDKAIAQGTGLEAFRKDFRELVKRRGWTGWTGEATAAGQAWRTRVIYQTNLASSFAAGRWAQLNRPEMAALGWWEYVHSDAAINPRPQHQAWDGLTLPREHPFWRTHFPPNGWGCGCRVRARPKPAPGARTQAPEGFDQVDEATGAPAGIDAGWGYAPGAAAQRPMQDLVDAKLLRLSAPVGAAMYRAVWPVLSAERPGVWRERVGQWLADPQRFARGRWAVAGALSPELLEAMRRAGLAEPRTAAVRMADRLVWGGKASRHTEQGNVLSPDELVALCEVMDRPDAVHLQPSDGRLIFVRAVADGRVIKVVVEPNPPGQHKEDPDLARDRGPVVVTTFKVSAGALAGDLKGGRLVRLTG